MRLRLLDLPAIGSAVVSLVLVGLVLISLALMGMTIIDLIPSARAGELDQARLRGSEASYIIPNDAVADDAPRYPTKAAEPLYPVAAPPYRAAGGPPPRPLAPPVAQLHGFTFAFGTRFWFSTGKLSKNLYDDPRSSQNLVSRLTYSGLTSNSFEGYGRADTTFGSFIKGYAGLSGLHRGVLNDEDFPPGITPYSNTLSQEEGGKLAYGAIDFGQIVVKNERIRASVFAGYGFLNETVSGYGCDQVAGNPVICAPALDPGLLAITEESSWQFARLGVLAEFRLFDRLRLSAEVAWLPFEQVAAQDTHWLRLGSSIGDIAGPIPEYGGGNGVQIEAIMSYQVSERASVGLGGRYWNLQTHGHADFESVIVGATTPGPQPLDFNTVRYGGFAQGSYKFGPL